MIDMAVLFAGQLEEFEVVIVVCGIYWNESNIWP
jgi:hypothetical protein